MARWMIRNNGKSKHIKRPNYNWFSTAVLDVKIFKRCDSWGRDWGRDWDGSITSIIALSAHSNRHKLGFNEHGNAGLNKKWSKIYSNTKK